MQLRVFSGADACGEENGFSAHKASAGPAESQYWRMSDVTFDLLCSLWQVEVGGAFI